MITNKITWIICSLGILALAIVISVVTTRDYFIYRNGSNIPVIITFVPQNSNFKSNVDIEFNYNNNIYKLNIHGKALKYHIGDTIHLKYLKGYEDRFLLSDYNPIYSGVSEIVLMLTTLAGSLYYFIRTPKT